MLAEFRLTWRQALARGLAWGCLGGAVLVVIVGAVPGHRELTELALVAVLTPLPLGVLCGAAGRLRTRVWLDEVGLRGRWHGPPGYVSWRRVVDVRAERRRDRTVVAIYLGDGTTIRLRAPYDGGALDRDPRFERKLVLICQVWEAHRHGIGEAVEARPRS